MRSLRARITVVTIIVAVIAVAITGLVSLQLVRSSTTDEARRQLSAQADILARLPRLASVAQLEEKASLALGGTEVALVRADGSYAGAAADYVDKPLLARVEAGERVSVTRRGPAGLVMIEARPTANGQAVIVALPLTAVDRALGQASLRIFLALGIGLVVAVVGGTLLARRLSRPLTDTAAAARQLARGERGVRMPAVSSRAARITEVHDVADALASLDTALAASEGRQREFLLSISHELRTPLTAVRGYAEAMADGLVTPDRVRAVGETLVAETERLDSFVADLLELARLEADDFSVTTTRVDVGALLGEAAAAWAGRASTLDVRVTATGTGTATTDARRLRQVVDGLVENALRVSPARSTVALSTARSPAGGVEVRVQDGGPGLAAEDIAVAFERGVLRARYRDIRPVGTGLGLSIASRLVERLGATIGVQNASAGGAVFTVSFPPGPSAPEGAGL